MSEMTTIITTVGSSLCTNFVNETNNLIGEFYRLKDLLYSNEHRRQYESYINRFKTRLAQYARETSDPCAEISSVREIITTIGSGPVRVQLLASQTILSWIAATVIQEQLLTEGYEVQFDEKSDIIYGLQVKDAKVFEREGLVNFIDRVSNVSNYGNHSVLNITGGYKALIPYATLLAQIYQIPMFYLFGDKFVAEEKYQLIEFPQAPIAANWSMFEQYENVIRDLKEGIEDWEPYRRMHNISEDFSACISTTNGKDAFLNAVGEMFYQQYQQFQMVYVLQNGPFSKEEAVHNRSVLHQEIGKLLSALKRFIQHNGLMDAAKEEIAAKMREGGNAGELCHAYRKGDEFFIYKCPRTKPEVRLLYSFDYTKGKLEKVVIYDFRIGHFNHSDYVNDFRIFYENNKDGKVVPYLQKKIN